jgi:hypothetical protein
MTNRRMFTLAMGLVLSAAPLLWLDLDPTAGDKLLRWTSKQPVYSAQLR